MTQELSMTVTTPVATPFNAQAAAWDAAGIYLGGSR
jgi:hypothetical protein